MNKKYLNQLVKILDSDFNELLVSSVLNAHGSFLMIDFGQKIDVQYSDQTIENRAPWILWLYMCAWRVTQEGRYLIGSGDSQIKIRRRIPFLINKKLIKASVNFPSLDIQLTFENEIKIESFAKIKGDDQWKLYRPDGLTFSVSGYGPVSLRE
jgi:hypothetical protein